MILEIQFGYGGSFDVNCVQFWCGVKRIYDIRCDVRNDRVLCDKEAGVTRIVGLWRTYK